MQMPAIPSGSGSTGAVNPPNTSSSTGSTTSSIAAPQQPLVMGLSPEQIIAFFPGISQGYADSAAYIEGSFGDAVHENFRQLPIKDIADHFAALLPEDAANLLVALRPGDKSQLLTFFPLSGQENRSLCKYATTTPPEGSLPQGLSPEDTNAYTQLWERLRDLVGSAESAATDNNPSGIARYKEKMAQVINAIHSLSEGTSPERKVAYNALSEDQKTEYSNMDIMNRIPYLTGDLVYGGREIADQACTTIRNVLTDLISGRLCQDATSTGETQAETLTKAYTALHDLDPKNYSPETKAFVNYLTSKQTLIYKFDDTIYGADDAKSVVVKEIVSLDDVLRTAALGKSLNSKTSDIAFTSNDAFRSLNLDSNKTPQSSESLEKTKLASDFVLEADEACSSLGNSLSTLANGGSCSAKGTPGPTIGDNLTGAYKALLGIPSAFYSKEAQKFVNFITYNALPMTGSTVTFGVFSNSSGPGETDMDDPTNRSEIPIKNLLAITLGTPFIDYKNHVAPQGYPIAEFETTFYHSTFSSPSGAFTALDKISAKISPSLITEALTITKTDQASTAISDILTSLMSGVRCQDINSASGDSNGDVLTRAYTALRKFKPSDFSTDAKKLVDYIETKQVPIYRPDGTHELFALEDLLRTVALGQPLSSKTGGALFTPSDALNSLDLDFRNSPVIKEGPLSVPQSYDTVKLSSDYCLEADQACKGLSSSLAALANGGAYSNEAGNLAAAYKTLTGVDPSFYSPETKQFINFITTTQLPMTGSLAEFSNLPDGLANSSNLVHIVVPDPTNKISVSIKDLIVRAPQSFFSSTQYTASIKPGDKRIIIPMDVIISPWTLVGSTFQEDSVLRAFQKIKVEDIPKI